MAVTIVSDTAALKAALGVAQAGDSILLSPGAYDPVAIKDFRFAGVVTIASERLDAPATLTGLDLRNAQGLLFQDLEFVISPTKGANQFQVTDSADIQFNRLHVHGSLDGDPGNDMAGLELRTSQNITITKSEFQQLSYALGHRDLDGLRVTDSWFHDLRMDGVRGSGTSNILIAGNRFTDFARVPVQDHADAIQLWTSPTVAKVHDISIRDNLIDRANGTVLQGIFIRSPDGQRDFERVTIQGNMIVGGSYNGIAVLGATDVRVEANVVLGFSDQKSWIRVDAIDGAVLTGNKTSDLLINASVTNVASTLNSTAALLVDRGAAVLSAWTQAFAATQSTLGSAGNDVLKAGPIASYMRGNEGADVLIGGAGFDDLNGNAGSDTINAGRGDDWVVGGKDSDLLFGEDGADLVYGNLGNDTCDGGAGSDTVRGGQDADVVRGGAGDDYLSGDRGNDTMVGGLGADVFHSFADTDVDTILDFNAREGDRVVLDAGTVYSVSQAGADTVVTMGAGRLILAGVSISSLADGWLVVG